VVSGLLLCAARNDFTILNLGTQKETAVMEILQEIFTITGWFPEEMTLGTALGLALTGLLFTLNGGTAGSPGRADHAFTVTALVLTAIAAASGTGAAIGT
jgi:hypothetical protein